MPWLNPHDQGLQTLRSQTISSVIKLHNTTTTVATLCISVSFLGTLVLLSFWTSPLDWHLEWVNTAKQNCPASQCVNYAFPYGFTRASFWYCFIVFTGLCSVHSFFLPLEAGVGCDTEAHTSDGGSSNVNEVSIFSLILHSWYYWLRLKQHTIVFLIITIITTPLTLK